MDALPRQDAATASVGADPLFELSFASAPIGMAIVALDGSFLRVNAAACELLGHSEEQVLSGGFQELTHPDDLNADLELLQQTIEGIRDGYTMDKRYLRPGGEIVFAQLAVRLVREPDGTPRYFISQIVDQTPIYRLSAALDEQRARLQALLDHSPAAIHLRDLEDRFIVANHAAEAFAGVPPGGLIGRTIDEVYPQEFVTRIREQEQQVLAAHGPLDFGVTTIRPGNGEPQTWWTHRFPVYDDRGEIIAIAGISTDVTDRTMAEQHLAQTRALFEAAFHQGAVAMLITRRDDGGATIIERCNDGLSTMLGWSEDDLVGRDAMVLLHPDDIGANTQVPDFVFESETPTEMRLQHREGEYVPVLVSPSVIDLGEAGERVIWQAVDISERKQAEHRLQYLADHDSLTELLNSRRFEEELSREVVRARRHGLSGCVLLIDLDGFKAVNDTFGHRAGDRMLKAISAAMGKVLREEDVLGRLGGDEFTVLLPETTVPGGLAVAAKLLAIIQANGRLSDGERTCRVSASIGLAPIVGESTPDADDLLVAADRAMYEAKITGRSRIVVAPAAGGTLSPSPAANVPQAPAEHD